jgi:hypothetical protein
LALLCGFDEGRRVTELYIHKQHHTRRDINPRYQLVINLQFSFHNMIKNRRKLIKNMKKIDKTHEEMKKFINIENKFEKITKTAPSLDH